ncbi:hypothetical protein [Tichowtungia aerotolerans]|uniref:Uncharacterized protein n=1 Tax=Tichowtungia aerotolerans TaxID=2697043 RepID=A0A6P1M2P5_9BACT|nr:hypothetical protein [Tichowtungia aerotolerans]QHI68372.1 hypothetical protein GT409_02505 [Tichowtungia aerotolerans]
MNRKTKLCTFTLSLWAVICFAITAEVIEAASSTVPNGVRMLTAKVDPLTEVSIQVGPHQRSVLERERYFVVYHPPGHYSDERAAELKSINVLPARGTGPYYPTFGLPEHHDEGADEKSVNQSWVKRYLRAKERYGKTPHALAGGMLGPEINASQHKSSAKKSGTEATMQVKYSKAIRSDAYDKAAQKLLSWVRTLRAAGASMPTWYTAINEPDASWKGTENPNVDHARYTRHLAKVFAAAEPEIKIAGPCSSWPYPQPNWARWRDDGTEKAFIDIAGDVVGTYDFHFYSKGYWADDRKPKLRQPHPSLVLGQYNGNQNVWDYGRMEAYLDLIAAYHQHRWKTPPKEVIISEFGRQAVMPQLGPWENEFKEWLYMTTVNRIWMGLIDRAEVSLAVPFILAESDHNYGPKRGQTMYTRPNAPEDLSLKRTRFFDFYGFYDQLHGTRVATSVQGAKPNEDCLRTLSFRAGRMLYIWLHNPSAIAGEPVGVALDISGATRNDFKKARIRRMFWDGPIPKRHSDSDVEGTLRIDRQFEPFDLSSPLVLQGEETVILEVPLSDLAGHERVQSVRQTFFAENVMVDLEDKSTAHTDVVLPALDSVQKVSIHFGLARDQGFDNDLRLVINGHPAGILDLSSSKGIAAFHRRMTVDVAPSILKAGSNRVEIVSEIPLQGGTPKWVSTAIDLTHSK